jgi:uncharacterized membrane protein YkoI
MRTLVLLVLASLSIIDAAGLSRAAVAREAAALHLAQAEDVKPLAQVLDTIGKRFPGRALDAELVSQGKPIYRVKWLGDDGKVREVTSDARSGKIIDVR